MVYVAFTLGLFGSLHCVGMCGPLAIAFCGSEDDITSQRLISGISYNLGRTLIYSLLGLFFGFLGSLIVMVDLQKVLSIVLGVLLVFSFFMSYDIDSEINRLPFMNMFHNKLRLNISNMYGRVKQYHPFILGAVNGFLPCGLVYLALAGAIASDNLLEGTLFMALFGLGTFPVMLALILGYKLLKPNIRFLFRRILPYITLCFGLFLIYRGVVVDIPEVLSFWELLKNPVMCH